jgi:hypothetical protein
MTAVLCRPFWPVSYGSELMWDAGYSQFNVSLISMDDFMPRTIRLRLEVRTNFFQLVASCHKLVIVGVQYWGTATVFY